MENTNNLRTSRRMQRKIESIICTNYLAISAITLLFVFISFHFVFSCMRCYTAKQKCYKSAVMGRGAKKIGRSCWACRSAKFRSTTRTRLGLCERRILCLQWSGYRPSRCTSICSSPSVLCHRCKASPAQQHRLLHVPHL